MHICLITQPSQKKKTLPEPQLCTKSIVTLHRKKICPTLGKMMPFVLVTLVAKEYCFKIIVTYYFVILYISI